MRRRRLLALLAAGATATAALAVGPPTPVAAAGGGSITIVVDTAPADGTDVGFTSCLGAGCGTFTLDDDTDPTLPDRITGTDLAPGTYTVTQSPLPGWTLTALTCTTSTGVTTDPANRRITVALTAGQDVACTFRVESPSITIVQDTEPDDPTDFGYTSCLGAGCGTFTLDEDTDPTWPRTLTGSGLAAGTYTITQDPRTPWSVAAIDCTPWTRVTRDLANRRVTFVLLSPTDHPTCTFRNVTQTITIVDDDLTDSGQDHAFTGCGPDGCAPFTLDDDSDPALPDRITTGPVATGTYTVIQDDVPGWELAGLTCAGETTDLDHLRVTIDLAAGEHRTCTYTNRPVPPSLTGVADVSVGYYVTCGLGHDTGVRCWGRGTLGDGPLVSTSTTARTVRAGPGGEALSGVTQVDAGVGFACAVLETTEVRCWGSSPDGGLGTGTTEEALPTPVLDPTSQGPLTGVVSVDAGWGRACAVLDDGTVRCWGDNDEGTLGNGTTVGSPLPVTVLDPSGTAPLTDVVDVAVASRTTCAVQATGSVVCWGQANYLGTGDTGSGPVPTPRPVLRPDGQGPLTGVTQIDGLWVHTCGRLADGHAVCWGNDNGQLGTTDPAHHPFPVEVLDGAGAGPLTDVVEVHAGYYVSCARLGDGRVVCWGQRWGNGMLGDGRVGGMAPLPVAVEQRDRSALTGAAQVTTGMYSSCASLTSGEVRCWGDNDYAELGDGTTFDRSRAVAAVAP
ncbi:MAG: hypothetical protein H6518_09120 [Microthrixaceae bacterium]|nr:hypothetical protein [Microthrixaceae bacterium]